MNKANHNYIRLKELVVVVYDREFKAPTEILRIFFKEAKSIVGIKKLFQK